MDYADIKFKRDYNEDDDRVPNKRKRRCNLNDDIEELNQSVTNSEYYQIKLPNVKKNKVDMDIEHLNKQSNDFIIYKTSKQKNDTFNCNKFENKTNFTKNQKLDFGNSRGSKNSDFNLKNKVNTDSTSSKTNSNSSYKKRLENLIREKKLSASVDYSIRYTINGVVYSSDFFKTLTKAEEDVCKKLLIHLQQSKHEAGTINSKSTESSNNIDSILYQIGNLLMDQDSNVLFHTEIPSEFKKKYGKDLPSNWFDKISGLQNNNYFKIKKVGPNMYTLTLI